MYHSEPQQQQQHCLSHLQKSKPSIGINIIIIPTAPTASQHCKNEAIQTKTMKLFPALLLGSATSVTWNPQIRSSSLSMDSSIIVTLPTSTTDATIGVDGVDGGVIVTLPTTSATDGAIGVDEVEATDDTMDVQPVVSYYQDKVVSYYGEGVSVTMDTMEQHSIGSSKVDSSFSSGWSGDGVEESQSSNVVTGTVKKSEPFSFL